ncbi:TMP repeat family [Streptococcus pneumoniae]|nr:TMP repeat family [Streptococcus pneumoniae]VRF54974.1 TMP repeat family [Streptococcus pneumoniae]VSN07391.1 TMP repeat family [Streptococcus pneumoniae]VSN74660.1 TMP repeat family [Streptococcus pneumoniae]VSR76447.1 TMP repeat family [Streptococcus pneumoniae]
MIESTEAFKKFANGQSWQQLDYQTQQQIRLMAILEQATAKYGNTLSNSVNGRISLFKSLMKDAALNLGNSMLPIINAIMPVLNSFAMVLKNVTAKLAEFIALMFNKKATVKDGVGGAVGDMGNAMKDAAGGAGDLADAVDDAGDSAGGLAENLGDSAKNAKKAAKELLGLLGFDEINILQKPKDDDAGGSGGGGKGGKGKGGGGGPFKDILPEVELTDMDNKFKSIFDGLGDKLKGLFDSFKKGFDAAFRPEGIERIKTALDQIAKTMGEIATDPRVVNAFNRMAEKTAYALGQVTGSIATIGLGIGVFLAESIANGLGRQKERITRALVALFDNIGNISEAVGNIAQDFSSAFYGVITSTGAVRIGSAIVSTLLSLTSTIVEVGSKLAGSLFKGFEKVVVTSAPKISSVFQSLLDTVAPVFESIERSVNKFGDGLSRVYDEHVVPAINSIANAFNGLIDIIQILWENSWQPFAEFLSGVFGVSIEGISDLLGGGLLATLGLLADAIKLVADGFTVFSDWCKENKEPIVALITTWQTINFLSWAEQAGGLAGAFSLLGSKISSIVGGIKNLGLAIKALTFDKLVSFAETIYLNTLYAKDFVVNSGKTIAQLGKTALELGKSALAWTAHAAKMGLATAAEFAHSVAAGVATAATWAFNAALAVLTSPITWVIAAIAALIAIGVLLYQNWDTVIEFAKTAWQGLCDFISGICRAIGEFFSGLWTKLQEIFEPIGQWFGEKFQQAWDAIVNIFTPIGSWFGQRWADVTSALANIGAWFTDMFQKAWTGLTNIFSKLGSWFGERWNDVTSVLANVSSWFGNMFTSAYNAVKNAFSSIGGFFSGVWSTVQSIFVNAGQKVGSAVGGAFRSAVNGVLGTIENVVNGFIGMINGVLGVVRNLPGLGWVGSVSTVSLPRLARGGIVDSPTIAMIGEAGKEAVVPLENTGFIQTLGRVVSSAVVNAMAGISPQGGFSGDGDIVIQIAGHEFGRVAIQEINKEHERAGQTLLKI